MARTVMLDRGDLRRSVFVPDLTCELREALVAYRPEVVPPRRVRAQPSPSVTAMVLVPGTVPGIPAYTVKIHAKSPIRQPALSGVICLHDLEDGRLLAIMDSGWLTAVRTGVGAAIAVEALARPDATRVGVIGLGAQGHAQLEAFVAIRRPSSITVFDLDEQAVAQSVATLEAELGLAVRIGADPADVASCSDIVMLATWSAEPLLDIKDVAAGTHITSLGADEPGKVELAPGLLSDAVVVTDDENLAAGVIPHADTTLSHVLRGEHIGRRRDDDITVYSPVGLPMSDCVIAWHAYQRAHSYSLGTPFDLGQEATPDATLKLRTHGGPSPGRPELPSVTRSPSC